MKKHQSKSPKTDSAHNVLLIQCDQWNARCLSLLGNPNVHTPNLDALAKDGVLFRNACAQNPICMPSRISMLSGQYMSTNRQFGFTAICDRSTPWLQGVFKRNGYKTAAFGKFHTLCISPEQWDFDVAAASMPEDHDLARPADHHYQAYCERNGIPWPTDQMHCHNPFGEAPPFASSARDDMVFSRKRACKSDVPLAHSLETWTTNACLDYLRQTAGDRRPFFIWLTYDRPHNPTTLPEKWFSQIQPEKLQLSPFPALKDITSLPPTVQRGYAQGNSIHPFGEEAFRFTVASYNTLINWLDDEIGRLVAALKTMGLDQTTTIVFTADHGDQAGYQGLYDKDLGCHSREIMSVPFIIRPAPCLNVSPAGRQCQEPVELVDLFPTLCALNGLETPAAVEGRNLEPALVRGEALDPSRPVFCEKYRLKSVIQNNWQLSFAWEVPEECLLIHYADDPWATRNLYTDDTWIEKRIELKRELFVFLMRRLHGPYTPSDADYFLDKLNGRNGRLPLLCPPVEGVSTYRSAGAIRQGNIVMYVPYFKPDFHLFSCKGKSYHTLADALPRDPIRVDSILDDGLNDCFLKVHPIAVIPSGFGAL